MTETTVRRWALLLPVCGILAISLLACQSATQRSSQADTTTLLLSTPVDGTASAMPTFGPFTIGAWPSNSMPGSSDQVTIYIICRAQDPTMVGPSVPITNLRVTVQALAPINRTYVGTTGSDGIASVRIAVNGARTGNPVIVNVAATWHNVTYHGQTTFTPAPQGQPTEPAESGTPTPGRNPTATPQSGPPPLPTPTPKPSPPPKPVATPTA